jgi:hypothetical protein
MCEGALTWKEKAMRPDNAVMNGEVVGQAEHPQILGKAFFAIPPWGPWLLSPTARTDSKQKQRNAKCYGRMSNAMTTKTSPPNFHCHGAWGELKTLTTQWSAQSAQ